MKPQRVLQPCGQKLTTKLLIGVVAALCAIGVVTQAYTEPAQHMNGKQFEIDHPSLREVSGISRAAIPNAYWLVNDSGAEPAIHLVTAWKNNVPARYLGEMVINDVPKGDFEDLASFTAYGEQYLLVADTGDNDEVRDHVWLHILSQPQALPAEQHFKINARPVVSIKLTYSDKARDVEAVAVDVNTGQILLISKRNKRPRVYTTQLPELRGLSLADSPLTIEQTAQRQFKLKSIPKIKQKIDRITAMDIADNGQHLVMQSYHQLWIWAYDGQSWLSTLQNNPAYLDVPPAPKIEGVTFDHDSGVVLSVSEKRPTKFSMVRVD